jgi:2'-5' RNA ligase
MSGYINFCFDDVGSSQVASMQQALADRDISHFAAWLNYPPHLSLVRVDDEDPELLVPAARRFVEKVSQREMWLAGLSLFGGQEPVIWLVPVPDIALLAAHQELCQDLSPLEVHTLYQTGIWMPHVTLAADLDTNRAVAGISALLPAFKPFPVTLNRVEVVLYPPAEVIWSASMVV